MAAEGSLPPVIGFLFGVHLTKSGFGQKLTVRRESKPTAWCWEIQSSTACSGHSSMYKRTVGFILIHDIQHQQKRRPGGRRNYCKRNCYVTFLRVDIPISRRISVYLVDSRKTTNETESIADSNINNCFVNLKVFCVMLLALPGRLIPQVGMDHPAIVACYSLAVTSVTTPAALVFLLKELARGQIESI